MSIRFGIMASGVGQQGPTVIAHDVSSSSPLTVTAHVNNDILLFCNNQTSAGGTIPSTTSGFTSLATLATDLFIGSNYIGTRLQWRVSDGTITSITTANAGGSVWIIRGVTSARGGLAGTAGISGVTSLGLPDLSGLNTGGTSLLVGAACRQLAGAAISAVTSPFTLTDSLYGKVANNTASSSGASKSLTQPSGTGDNCFVAEFLV